MDWWTAEELATLANVTARWVTKLCGLGAEGPFPNAVKRTFIWFIPRDEGQAWLDARTAQESPQES